MRGLLLEGSGPTGEGRGCVLAPTLLGEFVLYLLTLLRLLLQLDRHGSQEIRVAGVGVDLYIVVAWLRDDAFRAPVEDVLASCRVVAELGARGARGGGQRLNLTVVVSR